MMFLRPNWLWLLLLLIAFAYAHRRWLAGGLRIRRFVVLSLRLLLVAFLVMALARPVIRGDAGANVEVFLVDVSDSMSDSDLIEAGRSIGEQIDQRERKIRLIVFADDVQMTDLRSVNFQADDFLVTLRNQLSQAGDIKQRINGQASALEESLDLAEAAVRYEGGGRVHVYTDGCQTRGDARAAAERMVRGGIDLTFNKIGGTFSNEVILRSLGAPARADIGESVMLTVEIESSVAGAGTLRITSNGGAEDIVRQLEIQPGLQRIEHPLAMGQSGLRQYSVSIECAQDSDTTNNEGSVSILVDSLCRVGVIETNPDHPVSKALGAWLTNVHEIVSLNVLNQAEAESLKDLQLLVIADTPAEDISDTWRSAIESQVREGMGLLVSGGERSLGPGGYYENVLAEMLPLRFAQTRQRRDPSTTLVVIIDTSGSMIGSRVNLAKEIARLAIARLKPHDKVGIVEFYGSKRWAAPIQPASNSIDIQRALNRLSAGGGTVILPAMEEAYYALQNVHTRTRHVLVLTDGGVEAGQFEPLVRQMVSKGMVLSTVLVGPDTHSSFLASLAQWGRGRFYSAPDRFNLPEIITKQPESSLLSPIIEQPSRLTPMTAEPVVEGIDFDSMPALSGYVESTLKPAGELVLSSDIGHPLLANWYYGLGRVSVFASQLAGQWSKDLVDEPQYQKLFSNLIRTSLRVGQQHTLSVQPIATTDGVTILVDNLAVENGEALEVIKMNVRGGDIERSWTLEPTRPYRWHKRVRDLPSGHYTVSVSTSESNRAGAAAFTVPSEKERNSIEPNVRLFDDVAAMIQRESATAGQLEEDPLWRPRELWPICMVVSLILLLLNVLVRRFPFGRSGVGRAAVLILSVSVVLSLGQAAEASSTQQPAGLSGEAETLVVRAIGSETSEEACELVEQACRIVQRNHGHLGGLLQWLDELSDESGIHRIDLLTSMVAEQDADYISALKHLSVVVQGNPDDVTLWCRLGRLEETAGNRDRAIEIYKNLADGANGKAVSRDVLLRLALLLYEKEDVSAARQYLDHASKKETADANGVLQCVLLAMLTDDYQGAVELADAMTEVGAKPFYGHLFRGLLYLRMQRYSHAQQEYEKAYEAAEHQRDRRYALERVIDASRQAGQLTALAEQWMTREDIGANRRSALVSILRELGRGEDVLRVIESNWDQTEQDNTSSVAEYQHDVISSSMETNNTQKAQQAYLRLIERYPDRIEYRVGLVRLMIAEDRREAACKYLDDMTAQTSDGDELLALAGVAADQNLQSNALKAADKAKTISELFNVKGAVFEANLLRQGGQADKALELLRATEGRELEPDAMLILAETYEHYGEKGESLRLYQRIHELRPTEDVQLRMGWLMEQLHQYEQAYELWLDLWRTAENPAGYRRARQRVLDLASRTGVLADLAIELEESLDAGQGGHKELELLVDIYTRVNDVISVAEILYEYGRKSGDQVDMLKRLVQAYVSCERFGQCNAVLDRLIELDPENTLEYLQQKAVIAIERRRPYEAQKVLERMHELPGLGGLAEEYSAGVMDMLGLHEQAAECYARLLALYPDRIESYLLWGKALDAAGLGEKAIARYLLLLEDSSEDDLFTVAVDGLLNLDAPPAALKHALRRVCCRIATKPDKVFLYRLAVDIHEKLDNAESMMDVLQMAVAVAGERRGPLLRELMDMARDNGWRDRQIAFGRSILALGDQMPPQVFLELGEALVGTRQLEAAERCFYRAAIGSDYRSIQQRVAEYYEQAGMPKSAERVIRDLLNARPDDIALLLRCGTLLEQQGVFDKAYERYYHAVSLMLRRLPAEVAETQVDLDRSAVGSTGGTTRRKRTAGDADDMMLYYDAAFNGLLHAACMSGRQEVLLDRFGSMAKDELSVVSQARTGQTYRNRPRLHRMSRDLRYMAYAFHQPKVADSFDAKLSRMYSADDGLARDILEMRAEWNLSVAKSLYDPNTTDGDVPIGFLCRQCAEDEAAVREIIRKKKLTSGDALTLLCVAVKTNKADVIVDLLGLEYLAESLDDDKLAPTMLTTALAWGNQERARFWSKAWLDAIQRNGRARDIINDIEAYIRLVWNHLSRGEHLSLMNRLQAISERLDPSAQFRMNLIRFKCADAISAADTVMLGAVTEGIAASENVADAVEALDLTPANARGSLLSLLVNSRKPQERRELIMALVGALLSPEDAQTQSTLAGLFRDAPRQQLPENQVYTRLRRYDWNRNRYQSKTALEMGEALLEESPSSVPVLAIAATARQNAGQHDQAILLVREAIDQILFTLKPDFQMRAILYDLASIMTSQEMADMVVDLEDRLDLEGRSASLLYALGVLREKMGETLKAQKAFEEAFRQMSTNRPISRKLITLLEQNGQEAELAELLSTNLTKSGMMEAYEWRTLTRLYCNLYRPVAALEAVGNNESPLAPVDAVRLYNMMGKDEQLKVTFRRFLTASCRNQGRFYTPFWPYPPDVSGMQSYLAEKELPYAKRVRMFEGVAGSPGMDSEILSLLTAASPGRNDVSGLADGACEAWRQRGRLDELTKLLLQWQRDNVVNVKDQELACSIAMAAPESFPKELIVALDAFLISADVERNDLWDLGRFFAGQGLNEKAAGVYLWLVMQDALEGRGRTYSQEQMDRLESLLGLVGEPRRSHLLNWCRNFLAPTPVDNYTGGRTAYWLEFLRKYGYEQDYTAGFEEAIEQFNRGASSGSSEVRSYLARRFAAEGRWDDFVNTIEGVGRDGQLYPESVETYDVRRLLPEAEELSDPNRYGREILAMIDGLLSANRLTPPQATRQRALLASWFARRQLGVFAGTVIDCAEKSAGPLGEHWLWVADAARANAMLEKAIEIELKLLEARMLPIERCVSLLEWVEQEQGRAKAASLAFNVAQYSDHQDILKRAIEDATTRKDEVAQQQLQMRLQSIWGVIEQ